MPSLQIIPTLTCALCDQLIDFERQLLDTSEVVLFGTERYAWCLECGQQVARPWTAVYRRRWMHAARDRRQLPRGTVWSLRAAWRAGFDAGRARLGISQCDLPVGPERTAWVEGHLRASRCQRTVEADQAFRRWVRAREQARG